MTQLQEHLAELDACLEACRWAGDRTAAQAWDECERADWLLWWAAITGRNSHKSIVLVSAACARTGLQYVLAGEDRPRLAIEAAERWAVDPTPQNGAAAGAAAGAARVAARVARVTGAVGWAAAARAACAAGAARWVACAAGDARWVACAAGDAARAASAAAEADWDAHQEMCQIVRSMLICPFEEVA